MSDAAREPAADASGGQVFRCTVPAGEGRQRLDRFLGRQSFLPTRSRVAALVREGHVTVDGVVRKASFPVSEGEQIAVHLPPPEPSWVEPEDIALDVLHEDEAIIVIDKPAGMASHPAPGTRTGTLVAALLHRWRFTGDWPDRTPADDPVTEIWLLAWQPSMGNQGRLRLR